MVEIACICTEGDSYIWMAGVLALVAYAVGVAVDTRLGTSAAGSRLMLKRYG